MRNVLEKFGFRLEGSLVKHEKLGIVREVSEFLCFSSSTELEDHVKQLLRNQCRLKRPK
ncbi:hypothetical protein [Brevibacillus sp. H7]|uniref:hypothetical protein n=1 Tax=Brevibacillus sp. H7 TaxID=3349138 RepID=UPI003810709A